MAFQLARVTGLFLTTWGIAWFVVFLAHREVEYVALGTALLGIVFYLAAAHLRRARRGA